MHIIFEKAMPNGAIARFHTLDELAVTNSAIVATVTSRPFQDGQVCWQDRIDLSAATIAGEPYRSGLAALTAVGGYLAGGAIMDEPTALEVLRQSKLSALNRTRDDRLTAGCLTLSGPIDTDLVSRQNISGAVSMALLAKIGGEPFTITWRMRDNAYANLDADRMIALGVAVGRFVSAVYAVAFQVKDAIDAASSVDELEAIDLGTVEWPATAQVEESVHAPAA